MLWKKVSLLSLAGFAVGVLIGVVFALSGSSEGLAAALPNLFMGGVFGAVAMGSSVVYDIEKWSLVRSTATHFLLLFSLYCLIGFFLNWFSLSSPLFWIIIAVMFVGYVLIWLVMYFVWKRKIRKMNDELEKLKAGKRQD